MDSERLIVLIKDMIEQGTVLAHALGTIKGGQVQFDGEDTASNKTYKRLNNITLNDGDRVLLAYVGGTFVIQGKLT